MHQCPACDYELTMAEQEAEEGRCPSCGVYFAKYKARRQNAVPPYKTTPGASPLRAEPTFRLAADPVKVATRGLSGVQPVVVVDVHMRFWSMVVFMVKAALAAIPAMLILFLFFTALAGLIGGAFAGAAHAQQACAHYTSSELRTFVIQKTIKVGMKAADVKRSWGEPTKVRHAYPGGDEWEYWNPSGDQVVTFGQHGCVTGWYTHRD